ncbi:hypothetical protein BC629DRAFT_1601792 [Irpex lacteus]|nr:hypothetical protein BC629DRAFT_1601792 [Irpex lacteus]
MVNSGVIPLAVLCACLLLGGVASIFLTRKIATLRAIQDMERAVQAQLEAERIEREKPAVVDVYIQQPKRDLSVRKDRGTVPWPDILPIGVQLNEGYYCPHPHRVIEKRAGYDKVHFVDGNVLNVSVGIAMPRPPSQADMDMIAPIESFEYCIVEREEEE